MTVPILRPGDNSPEVRDFRAFLREKFAAYAAHLDTSSSYDDALFDVVREMQSRYGLAVTGIADYGTLIRCGWERKPVMFTVNGFLGDMWLQQPSDTARALSEWVEHQPVGYASNAFPLGIGVEAGVKELKRLIRDVYPGRRFILAGYSLGAIITGDVFNALRSGDLRNRFNDLVGVVTWGDPLRPSDGVTEGIAGPGANLTDMPPTYRTFTHPKDIYCSKPVGEAGEHYTLIFNLVLLKWTGSLLSILDQAMDLLQRPLPEVISIVNSVIGAIGFYSNQAPHMDYPIDGAVQFLRGIITNPLGEEEVTTPAPGTPQTSLKAIVGLIGSILTVAIPLLLQVSVALPASWQAVIGGVVAILTGLGVYSAPNKAKTT